MKTNKENSSGNEELRRCGFCGRLFKGETLLSDEELSNIAKEVIDNCPLGYCPNAQWDYEEQNPEKDHQVITRDMAIDAGDLSLEGQTL